MTNCTLHAVKNYIRGMYNFKTAAGLGRETEQQNRKSLASAMHWQAGLMQINVSQPQPATLLHLQRGDNNSDLPHRTVARIATR